METVFYEWNVGRGKISSYKEKYELCMLRTDLKHEGKWYLLSQMSKVKETTFKKFMIRVLKIVSHLFYETFAKKKNMFIRIGYRNI